MKKCYGAEDDELSGDSPEGEEAAETPCASFSDYVAYAAECVGKVQDSVLQEFLLCRLASLGNYTAEPEQWLLPAVDFIDELTALGDYPAEVMSLLDTLAQSLREQVEAAGAELLASPCWDPATQRAVKVNFVLPAGEEPVVVKAFATGVKLAGCLLRKQEVELDMPHTSS